MKLQDKKISILGCGRSGIAAAKLALAKGAAEICIFDSSAHAYCNVEGINCKPAASIEDARAYAADLVILSPGIEADTAWTRAFCEAKNAPLIAETEFAYGYFEGQIIAITGTNGKTTTTALIEHILLQNGKRAAACGNYGIPLSEIILDEESIDYAILEVSSFQMETIVKFCPDLAIWLNFAPDHMDRYREVEDYYQAKRRIFENMSSEQIAIVRVGEELGEIAPRRIEFSSEVESGALSYRNGHIIEAGKELLSLVNTQMEQAHNAENCMAAILACRLIGLEDKDIAAAIKSFCPPGHRCEMVAQFDRVLWLNDSKSTNLHSTQAAIRSQTRPIVLIAGGKDKGLDYSPLKALLKQKVRHAIYFGEIGKQLCNSLSAYCESSACESVQEAVKLAATLAQAGDVVLFSPGTSSFDQFNGYVQRGQCFRDTVLETLKP